jgi:hypothetical protein
LALLSAVPWQTAGWPVFARLSVLIEHFATATAALAPGGGRAALWQTLRENTTAAMG